MRERKKDHSETQVIQLAVWMIGMGFFILFDRVWPGIFILIGISMLIESFSKKESDAIRPSAEEIAPQSDDDSDVYEIIEEPPATPAPQEPAEDISTSKFPYRIDLLPDHCPWCGAPVYANDILWQSFKIACCSFCGANLIDDGPQDFRNPR